MTDMMFVRLEVGDGRMKEWRKEKTEEEKERRGDEKRKVRRWKVDSDKAAVSGTHLHSRTVPCSSEL